MQSRTLAPYFLVAILIGTLVLAYYIFAPFLTPLIMAAVFAVLLHPVYARILSQMPRWPSIASLLTVLVSIIVILIPLIAVGTQIGLEARDLYIDLKAGDLRDSAEMWARQIEGAIVARFPAAESYFANAYSDFQMYAESALQWLIQHLAGAFSGVAAGVLKFLLFFVALYYLLRDGPALKEKIVSLSPLSDSYDESVFDRLGLAVNSVVRGNLLIALVQGTLTAIGFTLFGVPHSILWGSTAAIAALIPGVGTGLIFVPTILFMYVSGEAGSAIGLAIWGIFAVGLVDNFLAPQLIGRGIKLHPFLVLLSVLGGLALFGPVGIFLGPLSVSLLFALLSIYADVSKRAAA
jgi:predicted PurR-regulated permease PerM